jgi:hypothetical protein
VSLARDCFGSTISLSLLDRLIRIDSTLLYILYQAMSQFINLCHSKPLEKVNF